MAEMRNCYDNLLSVAAAIANSSYGIFLSENILLREISYNTFISLYLCSAWCKCFVGHFLLNN
jgi:hypothetical protein